MEAKTFSYKIIGNLVYYYLDGMEFIHDKNKQCGEKLKGLVDAFNKNEDYIFRNDPCIFSVKSDDPHIYFRNKNDNTNACIFFDAYKNVIETISSKLQLLETN